MGCGIDRMSGQQFVFFTKNGETVSSCMINFGRNKNNVANG